MSTAATTPDVSNSSGLLSSTYVFLTLLVPAIALWYAYWRISKHRLIELASKIPGPKGLPLIGNALDLIGSSHGNQLFL